MLGFLAHVCIELVKEAGSGGRHDGVHVELLCALYDKSDTDKALFRVFVAEVADLGLHSAQVDLDDVTRRASGGRVEHLDGIAPQSATRTSTSQI